MKITEIRCAGLRGATPEGGWSNELRPDDCIHTLVVVHTDEGLIGCTQVTEILYTPGVQLTGLLPAEFELATVYTAALCSRAMQPEPASQFIALMAGAHAAKLRAEGGFEAA